MVPPASRWLLAATTAALVAVTGCASTIGGSASSPGSAGAGGGAPAAGAGPAGGGGGACGSESGFCITVDITGAMTLQGTAQALNLGGSCADYAKGPSPDGGLQLPGLLGEKIGSKELTAANEIRDYTGPGKYEKGALKSVAGVLDVSIDNTPYQPADNTTAQAVINADGSGSLTFTDLKEGEQGNPGSAKGAISGSFTWTCTD